MLMIVDARSVVSINTHGHCMAGRKVPSISQFIGARWANAHDVLVNVRADAPSLMGGRCSTDAGISSGRQQSTRMAYRRKKG